MLIVGVGNPFRGDDAAGLHAARLLRDRVPDGVVVAEFGGDASGLLDEWAGHESVIVIDAVSSGAAPGTVLRIDAAVSPVPAGRSGVSSHAFGVAEAIELGRTLGRLPERLLLYGIAGSRFAVGEAMDPAVERGVEQAVREILEKLSPGDPGGDPGSAPWLRRAGSRTGGPAPSRGRRPASPAP